MFSQSRAKVSAGLTNGLTRIFVVRLLYSCDSSRGASDSRLRVKFSRMDSLPNFLTQGAPLRARELRYDPVTCDLRLYREYSLTVKRLLRYCVAKPYIHLKASIAILKLILNLIRSQ